jgi:hypothetical protein
MPSFILPALAVLMALVTLYWLYRASVGALTRLVEVFVGGSAEAYPTDEQAWAPVAPEAHAAHPSPAE